MVLFQQEFDELFAIGDGTATTTRGAWRQRDASLLGISLAPRDYFFTVEEDIIF